MKLAPNPITTRPGEGRDPAHVAVEAPACAGAMNKKMNKKRTTP